jgi:hypothetical protein
MAGEAEGLAGRPVVQVQDREISIRLPDSSTYPAPEAANFFTFAWSGIDIQLLVGYIDLQATGNAEPGRPFIAEPLILHRFFMSARGLALLKHQLDEAVASLEASGVQLAALDPVRKPNA